MNIASILDNGNDNYGEKEAIIFNDKILTYTELNKLVNRLSNSFTNIGIKEGDRVALLLPNSLSWVISFFSIIKIKAIVVPLSILLSPCEILYILSNCNASSVITSIEFTNKILKISPQIPKLENILVFEKSKSSNIKNISELMNVSSDTFPTQETDGDATAVISYTLWDTGYPKGAMLTHKNFLFYCNAASKYFDSYDRVLCFSPLPRIFPLCAGLVLPLYKASTVILRERFIPEDILGLIESKRVTTFAGTPIIYKALLNKLKRYSYDLSSLHFCITGGDFIDPEVIHQFKRKSGAPLIEGYGLTECLPITANPKDGVHNAGSVGLPLDPGIVIKVKNESGQRDGVGEIVVKSPSVMKGYYGMQNETNQVLKNGWLYTGDIGRMDREGFLYIVGRKKRIIICGGYNVDPKEVESVLSTHPMIKDVNISGEPSELWGEIVKARITLNMIENISEKVIQDYCKERLAVYKIPRIFEFQR